MRQAWRRGVTADSRPWGQAEPRAAAEKPVQASARVLQPSLSSCPVSPNCWRNKGVETAAHLPVYLNALLGTASLVSVNPQEARGSSAAADHWPGEGLGAQLGGAAFRNCRLPAKFSHAGVYFKVR